MVPTTGRWQVTTETSIYLFDLDSRRVFRVPDAGAGTLPGQPPVPIAALRRDHEAIPLLTLICCEVGIPMRMMSDIRGDGSDTLRTTTIVRAVRELTNSRG